MPIIKPITDLKTKTAEISALAKKANEPIFLTKNGEGDLVVMSIDYYHAELRRQELVRKLMEAEFERASGAPTFSQDEVFTELRSRITK
jgi:prevent-host-death family protein